MGTGNWKREERKTVVGIEKISLKKKIKIWSRQYKINNTYINLKKEIGKCSLLIKKLKV